MNGCDTVASKERSTRGASLDSRKIMEPTTEEGIKNIINNCAEVRSGENVLLLKELGSTEQ